MNMNSIDHSQGDKRQHNKVLNAVDDLRDSVDDIKGDYDSLKAMKDSIKEIKHDSDKKFNFAIAFAMFSIGLSLLLYIVSSNNLYSMLKGLPDHPPDSMVLFLAGGGIMVVAVLFMLNIRIPSRTELKRERNAIRFISYFIAFVIGLLLGWQVL